MMVKLYHMVNTEHTVVVVVVVVPGEESGRRTYQHSGELGPWVPQYSKGA